MVTGASAGPSAGPVAADVDRAAAPAGHRPNACRAARRRKPSARYPDRAAPGTRQDLRFHLLLRSADAGLVLLIEQIDVASVTGLVVTVASSSSSVVPRFAASAAIRRCSTSLSTPVWSRSVALLRIVVVERFEVRRGALLTSASVMGLPSTIARTLPAARLLVGREAARARRGRERHGQHGTEPRWVEIECMACLLEGQARRATP